MKTTGTIMTIEFDVLQAAVNGKTYDFNINNIVACDDDFEDYSVDLDIHGIKVQNTMLGDVNDDGIIDVSDAVLVKQKIAQLKGIAIIEDAADVNRDGSIDVTDAVLIMQKIAGLIKEF